MERDEQVNKNLELTRRFLTAALDAPAVYGLIVERPLVFLPTDDLELARANAEMGARLADRGEEVAYVILLSAEDASRAVPEKRRRGRQRATNVQAG